MEMDLNAAMIDGLRVTLPLRHSATWREGRPEPRSVQGQHGAIAWLTSRNVVADIGHELAIQVNPSKFLQGHNLFGPSNLMSVFPKAIFSVLDKAGIDVPAALAQEILDGQVRLKSVSVNFNLRLPNDFVVSRYLSAAAGAISLRGARSRVSVEREVSPTIYIGKGSRTLTICLYNKGVEFGRNANLSLLLSEDYPRLLDFSRGLLRFEVTFHERKLHQKNLCFPAAWDQMTGFHLLREQADRLVMPTNLSLPIEADDRVPTTVRRTYHLWLSGFDVRNGMSESTFYKHRKELLPQGIDISKTPQLVERFEFKSISQLVDEKCLVFPPSWARGTYLYFE